MYLLASLLLAAGLAPATVTDQRPAPFELILPPGVTAGFEASDLEVESTGDRHAYRLSGNAVLRLPNGVQLRRPSMRLIMPAVNDPTVTRRLLIEADDAAAAALREDFVGLGLVLKSERPADRSVEIASIIDNAGDDVKKALMKGDLIQKVDGKEVMTLSLGEVVELIRGPEGTEVRLTVKREGEDKPLEFKLKRRKLQVPN
jgi:hypothetical protein